MKIFLIPSFFLVVLNTSGQQPTLFELILPAQSGVDFKNECIETPPRSIYQYDYFYNGGGVAIADFNNDERPDIFFTGNDVPCRLYFNKGRMTFEDVTGKSGINPKKWHTGVTVVDINSDGWLDIYICCSGPDFLLSSTENELYVNNGNGTFTEKAAEFGIADNGLSTQAVFFDMDLDGDLDLWVMNHAVRNLADKDLEWLQKVKTLPADLYRRFCNSIYRNDSGHYTDITSASGIIEAGFGLGLVVSDLNNDGLKDVYVCNDYFLPDKYYVNKGNGKFVNETHDKISHCSYFSMGGDAADINNDGWSDLVVLDMTPADHYRNKMLMNGMNVNEFQYLTDKLEYLPQYMFNTLMINNGYGFMSDIAQFSGVHQTDWSWAPLLADLDNDGHRDLFVTNGYKRDIKNNDWRIELMELMDEPGFNEKVYFDYLMKAGRTPLANQVYQNMDGYNFSVATTAWNLDDVSFSNGAAYGDLDADGDLDLVINNLEKEAFIYRNNASGKINSNYLRFRLLDSQPGIDVNNAEVTIHYANKIQKAENHFTRGYQSYVEPVIHFGLGELTKIDSAVVDWGNGEWTVLVEPAINSVHTVRYEESTRYSAADHFSTELEDDLIFTNITASSVFPPFYHRENEFNDFEKEVLLPHRQSMHGPGIAVADVNNDGLDDFFIGGAKGQRSMIYVQDKNGIFREKRSAIEMDTTQEVLGAAFFDLDKDGDQDLYVATGGGGEYGVNDAALADLIFLNDGSGTFVRDNMRLPAMNESSQVILTVDYDSDGDMDVFVGGRNVPGKYPLSPGSFLLKNEKGILTEDKTWSLEFNSLGMITGGVWHDWEGDGDPDLVLVGEWNTIEVFGNDHGRFSKMTLPFADNQRGWWYSIAKGDFDKDGDDDLIVGNVGENNKFHPSVLKPLHVFANDFDENGTLDIVLGKHYKDYMVPVRGKECSTAQMPYITKRFPTFDSFASSTLQEIYTDEQLMKAYHLTVNTFSSIYLENEGNGNYSPVSLPAECQFAPINAIVVDDFNGDGNPDALIAGNNTQTEVETVPYDAGKGLLLAGNGDGTFSIELSISRTGLFLPGDVKSIKKINLAGNRGKAWLVAKNNSRLNVISIAPGK